MSEWKPIETAPRDGTLILALEGEDTVAVVKHWDGQWWVNGARAYYLVPELWRHVPSGPEGQDWRPRKEKPLLVVVPPTPETPPES